MKKPICALCVVFLCLSLFACSPESPPEVDNVTTQNTPTINNAPPNIIPSGGIVVSEYLQPAKEDRISINANDATFIGPVRWFSPDGIGYTFITEAAIQTTLRTAQSNFTDGLTNRKTGIFSKIKRPAILNEKTVSGMGLGTIMDGHLLYKWGNYGKDQLAERGGVNTGIKLTCLDFNTGKETIEIERSAVNHTINTHKYSTDELISYYIDFENMDQPNEVLISIVEKYNIRTKKTTEIIRERCEWIDDKNTKGYVLEKICIKDDKIYGIGRVTENGKSIYYLYYFDKNGKLEKKINCQKLEEVLTDNSIQAFHVFGELIYIETSTRSAYFVYKVLENDVTPLFSMHAAWGEMRLANDNILNTDNYRFIPFFIMKDVLQETENRTIFACELSTGKVKCLDVSLESERQWIEDVYMNWDGGLCIVVSPGKGEDNDMQNQRQYFISKDKWEELFEQAPYCD